MLIENPKVSSSSLESNFRQDMALLVAWVRSPLDHNLTNYIPFGSITVLKDWDREITSRDNMITPECPQSGEKMVMWKVSPLELGNWIPILDPTLDFRWANPSLCWEELIKPQRCFHPEVNPLSADHLYQLAYRKCQVLLWLLLWVCFPKVGHCHMHTPGPEKGPKSGYWAGRNWDRLWT